MPGSPSTTFTLQRRRLRSTGEWVQLCVRHPNSSTVSVGFISPSSFTALKDLVDKVEVSDRGGDLSEVLRRVAGNVSVTSAKIRKMGNGTFAAMSISTWMKDVFKPKVIKKWPLVSAPLPKADLRFLTNRTPSLIVRDMSAAALVPGRANIKVDTAAVIVCRYAETHQITIRRDRGADPFPAGFPTLARVSGDSVQIISANSVESVVSGSCGAIYLTLGGCCACERGGVFGDYVVCFVDVESDSKIITLTNQIVPIVQQPSKRKRGS